MACTALRISIPTMSDVSVVLVGCGAPLKSMGWYHAIQILHKDKDNNM